MSGEKNYSTFILPMRKKQRLQGFDYCQPTYYFITICTHNRRTWFGNINNDQMHFHTPGTIAQSQWTTLPERFAGLQLDQFVIMPNHIHGLLLLTSESSEEGTTRRSHPSLAKIVGTFKGATSHQIHSDIAPNFAWQHGFYDSIVRNEQMLHNLRQYIINNPACWTQDQLYNSARWREDPRPQ
jgi:putative transposase